MPFCKITKLLKQKAVPFNASDQDGQVLTSKKPNLIMGGSTCASAHLLFFIGSKTTHIDFAYFR